MAEQWGTDSYWEQLARLIKDRTWTAAKEDVLRYVESGLRAAYAEQQRGKVKRFGGNTPIDDLADIIPENVRVGAAGVHGMVSPFTQDVASVVCSDPLTWLSIGADTTNLVPDGVSKRQWLAKLQTKAGGLIKVGKSVSPVGTTATVYCLFIYEETPTGDSGSSFGYSVDDTTSEAEHVMVLVPLSTPVPEPVTVDTCAAAHALPAADLIDDEGLAIHRSSYSLDVITRDDIGNFVIPGSAIVSVKLSEERTLVGSLIESVVYDELDFYVFDEFNDDIVSWTNGGIVEMTLKACAPITTTTTTMPPPSTTTVPPGHE